MSASAAIDVAIQIASDSAGIPGEETIDSWVRRTIDAAGGDNASSLEVAVRVVDEAEMRTLNSEYRSKDSTTNVLSFPAGAIEGLPDDVPLTLGDIVICAPVVAREAAEQGKKANAHWAHMLVHGTLHLLGFDHVRPDEAAAMEALEVRILSQHGVANPYNLA